MCVETETPKASMGEWGRVRDLRSIVGFRLSAITARMILWFLWLEKPDWCMLGWTD